MNKLVLSRGLSSAAKSSKARNVVLVDGCRIPFTLAGTFYKDYMAVDLARFALKGIVNKTAIDPKMVLCSAAYTCLCVLTCVLSGLSFRSLTIYSWDPSSW